MYLMMLSTKKILKKNTNLEDISYITYSIMKKGNVTINRQQTIILKYREFYFNEILF